MALPEEGALNVVTSRLRVAVPLVFGLVLIILMMGVLQIIVTTHSPLLAATSSATFDVVISEIAWAGTTDAWQDEWIELHNNTPSDIDLDGWWLVTDDGSPDIHLAGMLPANGYVLLERTDDASASPLADQIYSGNLSNSGEVVTLTNAVSNVVDVVGLPGEPWFAGDNATKQTMERAAFTASGTLSTSWTTGVVNGTPTNSILDKDSDTYGFSPNIDWSAGAGTGYESRDEDCDDSDTGVHPGATEALDYTDNDCDGAIDDGLDLGAFGHAVYFNSDTIIPARGNSLNAVPMETSLVDFINASTDSIDVAIYGLDRTRIRDALIAAHNRGVTVRVVGDDEAASGPYAQTFNALTAAGIPVVTDPYISYLQHNKFAIFDGRTLWTGSTNWTDNGFTYNANNSIVVTSTHLALAYVAEFEEMFDDGRFAHQKSDNTTHVFSHTDTLVESYFSPSDDVEARVAEVIANAEESLHFAMFFWTSDLLGSLVHEKVVSDGLTVSGVWDAVGAGNPYSEDELLCSANVPLKIETFGGKVHDKFAVVDVFGDDPVVILGSYNWTQSGAFDNDENTLIIHDAELAEAYYQEYLRLYEAIPNTAICGSPSAESGLAACQDGADNDYDGKIDEEDEDCSESTLLTCIDGLDNDGDGFVDSEDVNCAGVQSVFLPLVRE